jgi:hypothetical protein
MMTMTTSSSSKVNPDSPAEVPDEKRKRDAGKGEILELLPGTAAPIGPAGCRGLY